MTELTCYQVDVFTNQLFRGNPAAVVPLDGDWLPDALMQHIAAENNLAETAFVKPRDASGAYDLRWFSPTTEVDLCGHATLATTFVLSNVKGVEMGRFSFYTRSGEVFARRVDGRYEIDFPALPVEEQVDAAPFAEAFGVTPTEVWKGHYYLAAFAKQADLLELTPKFDSLGALSPPGLIATAPGDDVDYTSRFFAPAMGIPEDPATGSSHCVLAPYWAERLGLETMRARQLSNRIGEFYCQLKGDRVLIAGDVVLYSEGTIRIG